MNQVKTWQRILLCVGLLGMLAGESKSHAFAMIKGVHEDSYMQKINNDYSFASIYTNGTKKPIAKPTPKRQLPSIAVSAPRAEQVIDVVKVSATGYSPGYESTGKRPSHPQYGITYSGVKVKRDKNTVSTIAADPKVFPLGSILYIPGYGYGIVADTGSAIKGRKIDLYFNSVKQVYKEWGKKDVDVLIIKRGNGKCTEKMLATLGDAIQNYKSLPAFVLEEAI
ncbi:3D domain-containing protein [Paenibacillus sp. IHBB 10380]|uniref:3D domain-containing protein n=1 Tax=Paenibacillus sp. IHBB 10380 TaxID=1566358 RepID=UPI000AA51402|nr:3D domain-containing protein [Paenibacillus sp. IHBB 10380]